MATYTLIASNTITTTGIQAITFSSIPQSYTDLILKSSVRTTGTNIGFSFIGYQSASTTAYSWTELLGNGSGSSATSTRANSSASSTYAPIGYPAISTSTANFFTNSEMYIPNYTTSNTKQLTSIYGTENDSASTNTRLGGFAINWLNAGAITSLNLSVQSSGDIAVGSSFYLYGIKKS